MEEGEDREIATAFDSGTTILEMARRHARTQGSIRLRLEKLGKLPPSGEARYPNGSAGRDQPRFSLSAAEFKQ